MRVVAPSPVPNQSGRRLRTRCSTSMLTTAGLTRLTRATKLGGGWGGAGFAASTRGGGVATKSSTAAP
ncbi:hypothetical protein D3C72_2477680 [compost metagenome]